MLRRLARGGAGRQQPRSVRLVLPGCRTAVVSQRGRRRRRRQVGELVEAAAKRERAAGVAARAYSFILTD